MNYTKVNNYLVNNYNMYVGANFNNASHVNHKINLNGTNVEIHPAVDVPNNTISFISIRHKTNNVASLIQVINDLTAFFDLTDVPVINQSTNFSNVSVYILGQDLSSGHMLKLVLWDRISTMKTQFEIELKLEK